MAQQVGEKPEEDINIQNNKVRERGTWMGQVNEKIFVKCHITVNTQFLLAVIIIVVVTVNFLSSISQ